MAAAVVADVLAHGLGYGVEIGEDFLDGLALESGCASDGLVEFADVGGVMFVVMNLHRLSVNERLQRVVVVAERREFEDGGHFRRCLRVQEAGAEGQCAGGEGDGFEGVASGGHRFGMVDRGSLRSLELDVFELHQHRRAGVNLQGEQSFEGAPLRVVVGHVDDLDAVDEMFEALALG